MSPIWTHYLPRNGDFWYKRQREFTRERAWSCILKGYLDNHAACHELRAVMRAWPLSYTDWRAWCVHAIMHHAAWLSREGTPLNTAKIAGLIEDDSMLRKAEHDRPLISVTRQLLSGIETITWREGFPEERNRGGRIKQLNKSS